MSAKGLRERLASDTAYDYVFYIIQALVGDKVGAFPTLRMASATDVARGRPAPARLAALERRPHTTEARVVGPHSSG